MSKAPSRTPGDWSTPFSVCGCSCYTCCCSLCAAADIEEHLERGSWWCRCCQMALCNLVPYVGFVYVMCNFRMVARDSLANKYRVHDRDGTCLKHMFCSSCLLEQELQHIRDKAVNVTSRGMSASPMSGASK